MTAGPDPALVEAYRRDGVVVVRGVLEVELLDELAAAVEANRLDPGPDACVYDPDATFWDDYCNWERFDAYRRLALESPLPALVGQLMGSTTVRFFHEHVLVKEAGSAARTPWHHDQPYYCVDGDQLCSVWAPLDPVGPEAALEFVAGSHTGPLRLPRRFVDHADYDSYGDAFPPVPDIDADRDRHRILSWATEPGDVLVFHMRTLHSTPPAATTARRRRAVATRWLGDDAVFARRPGPTSPPMTWLTLEPGAPLVHPRLPVAWRAPGADDAGVTSVA